MNEPQESKAPLASLARTIELRGGQADPEAHAAVQDNPCAPVAISDGSD